MSHNDETSIEFHDTAMTLSQALKSMAGEIRGHGDHIEVRNLLQLAGEQGLLLGLMLLTVPFLIPVSIPGVSTVFGLVGILISIGVTLNRVPWLPDRLLDRAVDAQKLAPAVEKGADTISRIDRFTHPRLGRLTEGRSMNLINGLALLFGNILLIFPFGFIPMSNTLPGWAILLLAAGMIQKDGLLILLGYLMLLATVIYFAFLIGGALAGGMSLINLFSG